jgi:transaldolase|tara:strand:- start:126 stop:824 length:699 start_codon:yes stop_codon:yes gene_type:complete
MKTKIFCDSANFQIIKKFNNNSLVSGFTTNPSLMRLSGAKNYKNYSLKLLKVCKKKPISLEVFGDSFEEMLTQAMIINSWGKNVYVKIPVVNSRGLFSGKVIRRLSEKGVKLNITAVYTVNQVKKILKSINKNSKTIISIFSGRMGDVGKDPVPIIKKSVTLTKKLKNVAILWASTREAYNYLQSKNCGCSIITMPPSIIQKISKFGKTYQELTLDTVKKFLKDSKDSNFKI